MKTSNIDKAFQKMPKMINVPQQQYPTQMFMNQQYPNQAVQMMHPYHQQQMFQQTYGGNPSYQYQYPSQQYQQPLQQYQNTQPQEQIQQQDFAQEYTKHYIDYWNNYYENIKNGVVTQQHQNEQKAQTMSSINDRFYSDQKQTQQTKKNDSIKENGSDLNQSQGSKYGRSSMDSKENINKIKQAITEEVNEAKSELSVDSDLLKDQFRKKPYVPEEEDLIPVNQNFLLEQSIDEIDFDRYIPDCKVEPSQMILQQILEEERIEKEKKDKIQKQIEAKQLEEDRIKQDELREQKEHDQFYEDNPEIYLEHRKKQKKVIFQTLKYEMDKIIDKTEQIEKELFEDEKGVNQMKKETEANSLKRKKAVFYLRAKKLQRDIDDVIVQNKEEDLAETNFELLKGLHESIVDDQLERMYEKNQLLFLQVSQALQDIVGVHNKSGTFQQYNYYESLKQNARNEIKKEQQQMEKKKKLYGDLLPPQKYLVKNKISVKRSKSQKRNASQDQKKNPLHKKAWNQH